MAKKQSSSKSKNKSKSKSSKLTQAQKADKYTCYQKSVQEPEHEVDFFEQVYKEHFKRVPTLLREDFCGTFAVCCEWAKSKRTRQAVGIDLDPEPIAWGTENNLSKLDLSAKDRVTIIEGDVRTCQDRLPFTPQIIAAQNFSFWFFMQREELRRYFESCRESLDDQGILVLDMMGGSDCYIDESEDERKVGKFTYVWGQEKFNPITNESWHYISFRFKDGSALEKAFTYNWRFWTIPEVMDILREAGFSDATVYWEDEEDEDKFSKAITADADASWVCYIVSKK